MDTEISEIRKKVMVGRVKYLCMQNFADLSLHISHDTHGVVEWIGGFYTIFKPETYYDSKDNTLLIYVPDVYYYPEEYHRFIKINTSTRIGELIDKSPEPSTTDYTVLVLRHEPYEIGNEINDVNRRVLESIKKMEESRKTAQQTAPEQNTKP